MVEFNRGDSEWQVVTVEAGEQQKRTAKLPFDRCWCKTEVCL
jgi:hypothetical protein